MVIQNDNRNSIIIDPQNKDTQKNILIHELGHCACAKFLGYNPKIHIDLKNELFYTEYAPYTNFKDRKTQIKDQSIIALGGYKAEELVGVQTIGFLKDQADLFALMKELHGLEGKSFPYPVISKMPYELYQEYSEKARDILTNLGGKKALERVADNLMQKLGED